MADDRQDSSSQLERRKFLALLGAAGAYVPPTLVGLLRGTTVSAQTSSHSSSCSSVSSSTSGGACHGGAVLYAIADTFLRRDSPNTNEGANPAIRVGVDPVSRGVVLFDRNDLFSSLFNGARVQLVLRIANNHNDWGQFDDRTVSVRPLLQDFVEGNGLQSGLPGWQAVRGTGAGATWNSPEDPNVNDNTARGLSRLWRGGAPAGRRTAPPVVHVNQMAGVDVTWDVTGDLTSGLPVAGWLMQVDREPDGDDEHPDRKLPAGDDRGDGGTVEYYSREGAVAAGYPYDWAPRLVIS